MANLHIEWTIDRILFIPVFLVSAAAIRTAISFAANASAFWIKAYTNAFPLMVYQLADFAKYPTTIFATPIRVLVTGVVPYAFISYIPTAFLLGKGDWAWTAWLIPLVALWCAFIARAVFYRGLAAYESSGN
jgi:ABC-2 type transport system permease protein